MYEQITMATKLVKLCYFTGVDLQREPKGRQIHTLGTAKQPKHNFNRGHEMPGVLEKINDFESPMFGVLWFLGRTEEKLIQNFKTLEGKPIIILY